MLRWALPDQMAQAGFYHQPNSSGDDRAMCFTCIVCLVCWEPADEPWLVYDNEIEARPSKIKQQPILSSIVHKDMFVVNLNYLKWQREFTLTELC